MIRILYFASLREELGLSEEEVEHVDGWSVSDLLSQLRGRGGEWELLLGVKSRVRAAVNQEFATMDTAIADGDEVGLFPPVTGG